MDLSKISKEGRRALKAENKKWPSKLKEMDMASIVTSVPDVKRIRVLRSKRYLMQVFNEGNGILRLSVNITEVSGSRFKDGISWERLQELKKEAGYGDQFAVEIFPAEDDEVNVANMRHLFVLPNPPGYAWRRNVST